MKCEQLQPATLGKLLNLLPMVPNTGPGNGGAKGSRGLFCPLNVTVIEPSRELRCHLPSGTFFSHEERGPTMSVLLTAAAAWAGISFLFSWFWGIAISRVGEPADANS